MSQSNKRTKYDNMPSAAYGDERTNNVLNDSIDKPLVVSNPSLFQYPFMFPLVIAYLDDQDVILTLLLVNKAMKPHLTEYRLKAPIKQKIAIEISNPARYLNIVPTQLSEVTDLTSLARLASITCKLRL